jgi:hypothetical protein
LGGRELGGGGDRRHERAGVAGDRAGGAQDRGQRRGPLGRLAFEGQQTRVARGEQFSDRVGRETLGKAGFDAEAIGGG